MHGAAINIISVSATQGGHNNVTTSWNRASDDADRARQINNWTEDAQHVSQVVGIQQAISENDCSQIADCVERLHPPVYYRHVLRGNSPPQDQDILMFGGKIPKQWMTYIQLNGSPISSKYPQSNPLLLDPRAQDQCSMWSKLKNTSQKKTNL